MHNSDINIDLFARLFSALGDANRQHILELLRENEELTVTDIASHFNLAQPTISQHLKVLREIGVVQARRAGQHVYYRICNVKVYDAMKAFMAVYAAEKDNKLK